MPIAVVAIKLFRKREKGCRAKKKKTSKEMRITKIQFTEFRYKNPTFEGGRKSSHCSDGGLTSRLLASLGTFVPKKRPSWEKRGARERAKSHTKRLNLPADLFTSFCCAHQSESLACSAKKKKKKLADLKRPQRRVECGNGARVKIKTR